MSPIAAVHTASAQAPATASSGVGGDYRLGSGDKLRIIVFGEPDLSGEFFVNSDGKVQFPLIGEVAATGLSLTEFKGSIETALRQGYLKDPQVSVDVENYRPFYILGEVNKPGEYPYTAGLTIANAVATAQGYTYRANTKIVAIKHAGDPSEHKEPLTATTMVAPGDTIRIIERIF
jgi:polysaccharide export outer membrane protein